MNIYLRLKIGALIDFWLAIVAVYKALLVVLNGYAPLGRHGRYQSFHSHYRHHSFQIVCQHMDTHFG